MENVVFGEGYVRIDDVTFELGEVVSLNVYESKISNSRFNITVIFCDKYVFERELVGWVYGNEEKDIVEVCRNWLDKKQMVK